MVSLGIFSVAPSDGTMCLGVYSDSENEYQGFLLGSTQTLKMSTRDFSWGKGGRCVWLTTYHPYSAERQENPGP